MQTMVSFVLRSKDNLKKKFCRPKATKQQMVHSNLLRFYAVRL